MRPELSCQITQKCSEDISKIRNELLHHHILVLFAFVYRETQVLLAPQEKLALWAPRVCQENLEQKVSEDSQDQWSVKTAVINNTICCM